MTRDQRIGIFYILTAVTGYSFFAVFTKTLLGEGMAPIDIGLWRFVIAVSILWALRLGVGARQGRLTLPKLPLFWVAVMGVTMALAALAGFFGLERLPSATYLVLFYSYPMMAALIEAALGKRLPGIGWVALTLTLVGVLIAAPDFSAGLTGENAVGVLIAFVNALVVALYFIISNRVLQGTSDRLGATAMILTATLIMIGIVALLMGANMPPTPRAWLLVAALAVVSTVIPVFALNQGIPRLGGAQSGIISSIEPIMASLLAMVFLGEIMTGAQWAGGLVIVAGIVVLQAPALLTRRKTTDETPITAP